MTRRSRITGRFKARRLTLVPAKSAPHVRGWATRRMKDAPWIALRDATTARLRAGQ